MVKEYKHRWAIDRNLLNEREVIVLSLLKERIDKVKGKYGSEVKVKQVLKNKVHLQYL